MKATVVKGMLFVGGAALATAAMAAQEVQAQGVEGAYGGLSFGIAGGTPDNTWPEYSFGGAVVGAFLGYNAVGVGSFGNLVIGPEFVWHRQANVNMDGPFMYGDLTYRNVMDLRVRVGQTFGNTLVYGAAGFTRATAQTEGGGKIIMPLRPMTTSSAVSGFNIGVGFETGLSGNMFIGGDLTYRRMDVPFGGGKAGRHGNLTTATVRVGFRF